MQAHSYSQHLLHYLELGISSNLQEQKPVKSSRGIGLCHTAWVPCGQRVFFGVPWEAKFQFNYLWKSLSFESKLSQHGMACTLQPPHQREDVVCDFHLCSRLFFQPFGFTIMSRTPEVRSSGCMFHTTPYIKHI